MSVPAGYASPNPKENATLNQATGLTTILAALGLTVKSVLIQTGEGNSYAGAVWWYLPDTRTELKVVG
jgi:hypothetical protein